MSVTTWPPPHLNLFSWRRRHRQTQLASRVSDPFHGPLYLHQSRLGRGVTRRHHP